MADTERETVKMLFQHWAGYHHYKETMAYSIFALQGAFFLGLFLLGNWPPSVAQMSKQLLSAVFVVTWFLFHSALRFQLRNRRLASIKTAACLDALLQTELVTFRPDADMPQEATRAEVFWDTYVWPIHTVFRPADIELEKISANTPIQAATIGSTQYHEYKHRQVAQRSYWAYAFPIEWITSIGSILLLGVAMLRVWVG